MEKFTIVSDKSENMIKEDHFYSLDDIKEMIPMLDEVTYHLLFLRFNKGQLTESEVESTQIIIKRLQNNDKHFVEDIKEKFVCQSNQVEELDAITIDEAQGVCQSSQVEITIDEKKEI